jgi:hypothetical protein
MALSSMMLPSQRPTILLVYGPSSSEPKKPSSRNPRYSAAHHSGLNPHTSRHHYISTSTGVVTPPVPLAAQLAAVQLEKAARQDKEWEKIRERSLSPEQIKKDRAIDVEMRANSAYNIAVKEIQWADKTKRLTKPEKDEYIELASQRYLDTMEALRKEYAPMGIKLEYDLNDVFELLVLDPLALKKRPLRNKKQKIK